MLRRLTAAITALTLVLLLAAPALAGGWAEIVADARTVDQPPVEGQPTEVGFTVLQHGVTPAGWEFPTVTFTEVATGATVTANATQSGPDGHFVATATMPSAGYWTWTVRLRDLLTDPVSHPLAVQTTDGVAPAIDPAVTLAAIERVRRDVTTELSSTIYAEIGRLESMIDSQRSVATSLTVEVDRIAAERDVLADRLEAAEAALAADGTGLPLLGIALVAILAGAAAGFAMAWLAGRPRPREIDVSEPSVLSPTPASSPRGSMPG